MTGLVGYGSSDEEDFIHHDQGIQLKSQIPQRPELSVSRRPRSPSNTRKEPTVAPAEDDPPRPSDALLKSLPQAMALETSALSAPPSPYTNHRTTIRNLTLPTKPNLDIPQSPLDSPTQSANQKFSHFLDLKRQGVHFNTKLASSSALKNPSLLPKLMEFAGVGNERQYTTTLPTELWNPARFPTWAYKEELLEAQHRHSKREEEERVRLQRESIDFVAAGTQGQPSGLVAPKATKASAAERVMAGLERNRHPSPRMDNARIRIEVERRGRTSDGLQAGRTSESPRVRKRSHSR